MSLCSRHEPVLKYCVRVDNCAWKCRLVESQPSLLDALISNAQLRMAHQASSGAPQLQHLFTVIQGLQLICLSKAIDQGHWNKAVNCIQHMHAIAQQHQGQAEELCSRLVQVSCISFESGIAPASDVGHASSYLHWVTVLQERLRMSHLQGIF